MLTTQSIEKQEVLKEIKEQKLVQLLNYSFDLDANLVYIAKIACEGELLTDGLCCILLCKDLEIQLLALSSYI